MASHGRINLPQKTLLVQSTSIARVIDVGSTLRMQTPEVRFFRHEALKTQKYVADHDLLYFLKLKKIIQLFLTLVLIMIRLVNFLMSDEKKYKYFQV